MVGVNDRRNARQAAYARTPQGRAVRRRARLKHRYGITEDDYLKLLADQGGVCFLCGEEESVPHHASRELMKLCVDHDHDCDKGHAPDRACKACIRGLLCWNCNRMIGRAERSRLRGRFADYLARRPFAISSV